MQGNITQDARQRTTNLVSLNRRGGQLLRRTFIFKGPSVKVTEYYMEEKQQKVIIDELPEGNKPLQNRRGNAKSAADPKKKSRRRRQNNKRARKAKLPRSAEETSSASMDAQDLDSQPQEHVSKYDSDYMIVHATQPTRILNPVDRSADPPTNVATKPSIASPPKQEEDHSSIDSEMKGSKQVLVPDVPPQHAALARFFSATLKQAFQPIRADLQTIRTDLKAIRTDMKESHAEKTEILARLYERDILRWLPHDIEQWWGCFLPIIYGRTITSNTDDDYQRAFKLAHTWFTSEPTSAFRALHDAVLDVPCLPMFDELEYTGLATARLPGSPALPSSAFVSPSKRAAQDNIIIVAETTMQCLNPSNAVVAKFTKFCNEQLATSNQANMNVSQIFIDTCTGQEREECNKLRNLLRMLLLMEKQVTVQLYRYSNTVQDVSRVRAATRCVLVSCGSPTVQLLDSLFASKWLAQAFYNISRLYASGNFKPVLHRTSLSSMEE